MNKHKIFKFFKKKHVPFIPRFDNLLKEILYYVPDNKKWHKMEIKFYAKKDGDVKLIDELKVMAVPVEDKDTETFKPLKLVG